MEKEIQKAIADQIKQINWLRQNPMLPTEQLETFLKLLEEAARALEA